MGCRDVVAVLAPTLAAIVVVAGAAREARADDPEEEGAPTGEYPRELWARPLVLPEGMVEADGWLTLRNYHNDDVTYTSREVEPGLRARLGPVELAASVTLHAGVDDQSDPPLADFGLVQYATAAVRYALHEDGYLGLSLAAIAPSEDFHGSAPAMTARYKVHSSSRVAGVLGASLGLRLYSDASDPGAETYDYVFSVLDVHGQARLSSRLAFDAALGGHYRRRVGHDFEVGETVQYMTIEVSLSLVASLTPRLDAMLFASTESLGTRLLSFGLSVRGEP